MNKYAIAAVPGDGIGPEVIREGVRVLQALAQLDGGFSLEVTTYPWGCGHYLEHGAMLPADGMSRLADSDAIYLGAVGHPAVPDHISLSQLLFRIRREFNQYINLRPIKALPGVYCPLKDKGPADIDMLFVRENSEGEYGDIGGSLRTGTPEEVVIQTNVFTRLATERVMRYAFETARKRRRQLTSVTKSNALKHSMVFWDRVCDELSPQYDDVACRKVLVDAMALYMVTQPERFDVVVASNLFGDILTDLGAALQGGMGLPPGGNINPEKKHPSMFEPIHGSAPDIAGQGLANPLAAIWAGQMMLEHLGEEPAAALLLRAIEDVTARGEVRTADWGGTATTAQMADAVIAALQRLA